MIDAIIFCTNVLKKYYWGILTVIPRSYPLPQLYGQFYSGAQSTSIYIKKITAIVKTSTQCVGRLEMPLWKPVPNASEDRNVMKQWRSRLPSQDSIRDGVCAR